MEKFYGQDFAQKKLELNGLRIDPVHREDEPTLARQCWYDYRGAHPVMLTYFYAYCYAEQTKAFYAMCVDEGSAVDARAFTPDDIFLSRDMTAMWIARATADRLGMPYPFVLRFAQDRFFSRAQRTFPRPNQLYGEEFEADLAQAWKERIATQLVYSKQSRYHAAAWRPTVDQAKHLRFVLDQIAARPQHQRFRLVGRLMAEGVVSARMVRGRFTQSEIASAEQYAQNLG